MRKLYPCVKLTQKTSKNMGRRLALFFLFCGILTISANAQTIRYVKKNAASGGNGTSWTNAYNDLQSALDVAVAGDEIWVAKGTYTPSKDFLGSTTSDRRTWTFQLKSGIKMYGGFAGIETTLNSRSNTADPTILSGDFDNNDGANFTNNSENAYHVMAADVLSAATELDGFTIKGGNANSLTTFLGDSWGNNYAGGLYINQGTNNLKVNRCVFISNYGKFGGGALYPRATSGLEITNCVFTDNATSNSYGGAIYLLFNSSSTKIINCVFVNNYSGFSGGALHNRASNTQIINCTFTRNTTSGTPSTGTGAIHNENYSPIIMNTIVWNNTGGNIGNDNATPTVSYSNIQGGYSGTNNINVNPAFDNASDLDGADNIWMTSDDGLHLRNVSPSANSGNNADAAGMATDITGAARIQNTTVNMGAYETVKVTQTITFTGIGTKTYGDADFTLSATASSGLPVSFSIVSGPATVTGNTVIITGAGSVVIKASQEGDATYTSAEATQTITINKKTLTVTADAKSKIYGDANPTLSSTMTGFVGSDNQSSSTTGAPELNVSATTPTAVGTYTGAITASIGTLVATNYDFEFATGTLTINQRVIKIKANDASKVIGSVKAFAGNEYSLSLGSLALGDAITGVSLTSTGAVAGAAIGTYDIIVSNATGIAVANYDITYEKGTLTVTPCASVTINTQPLTQVKCAGENVTFSVGATGTGLSYQWMKGTTPVGTNDASYTINGITAGDAGEYSVVVTSGCSVTSSKATLTVNTVNTPTITVNGNVLTSSAAAGNQWFLNNAPINNATAQTYTVQAAGPYKVTVTQNGCTATSAIHNFVPTAVGGVLGSVSGVRVYPTIMENRFFTLENTTGHALEVVLVDNSGHTVKSVRVSSSLKLYISTIGLANGTYQVVVKDTKDGTTTMHRVIKVQ